IRWSRKAKYMDTFEYYKGLIKLRKEHSAFRMDSAEKIKENLKFYDLKNEKDEIQELVVSYTLNGKNTEDTWDNIFVIYNGNREDVKVKVPNVLQGEWDMVVNGKKAGTEVIKKVDLSSGEMTLDGSSAVILKK
ncbi:MAG: alpha-1,6-glucosidase domain-containing protein, partial [Fusobacteriota bacterium]